MWIFSRHNYENIVGSCRNSHKSRTFKLADYLLCKSENPQKFSSENVENSVDNVDNLYTKKVFPYFYNVSGTHSYQQITLDTIF